MTSKFNNNTNHDDVLLIGVLALQGAFEEHQACLHAIGCHSIQVRTPLDLESLDAIILPGGESTAMGLIGTATSSSTLTKKTQIIQNQNNHTDNINNNSSNDDIDNNKDHPDSTTTTEIRTINMWDSLRNFSKEKPVWGTCAGMILLAERCIGTSAVIEDGQALIGGVNITVCRNYFGSQVSSFEMETPPPPPPLPYTIPTDHSTTTQSTTTVPPNSRIMPSDDDERESSDDIRPFPGVFIRAPAILSVGPEVQILGTVVATPCRQAAATLQELERKIAAGEDVVKMRIENSLTWKNRLASNEQVIAPCSTTSTTATTSDETLLEPSFGSSSGTCQKSDSRIDMNMSSRHAMLISLPGAAEGTNAREVICAARKGHILCTAFHPELTDDYRWHQYFAQMVKESKKH